MNNGLTATPSLKVHEIKPRCVFSELNIFLANE